MPGSDSSLPVFIGRLREVSILNIYLHNNNLARQLDFKQVSAIAEMPLFQRKRVLPGIYWEMKELSAQCITNSDRMDSFARPDGDLI